jgi:hypothetical protein
MSDDNKPLAPGWYWEHPDTLAHVLSFVARPERPEEPEAHWFWTSPIRYLPVVQQQGGYRPVAPSEALWRVLGLGWEDGDTFLRRLCDVPRCVSPMHRLADSRRAEEQRREIDPERAARKAANRARYEASVRRRQERRERQARIEAEAAQRRAGRAAA